jgi:hypothetical protein
MSMETDYVRLIDATPRSKPSYCSAGLEIFMRSVSWNELCRTIGFAKILPFCPAIIFGRHAHSKVSSYRVSEMRVP